MQHPQVPRDDLLSKEVSQLLDSESLVSSDGISFGDRKLRGERDFLLDSRTTESVLRRAEREASPEYVELQRQIEALRYARPEGEQIDGDRRARNLNRLQSRSEVAEGEARKSRRHRRGDCDALRRAAEDEEEGEEVAAAAEEGQVGRVDARQRRRQEGQEKEEEEGGVRRHRRRQIGFRQQSEPAPAAVAAAAAARAALCPDQTESFSDVAALLGEGRVAPPGQEGLRAGEQGKARRQLRPDRSGGGCDQESVVQRRTSD